jgi:opacity protein-like surface antigen
MNPFQRCAFLFADASRERRIGTNSMRRWWLTGAALSFLAGAASAETSGIYVNPEIPVLLPPAITLAQPNIAQTASLESRNSFGTVYGYNLGDGFKTEIEGVTTRAPSDFANLPAGGGIVATSVMLRGMYEFSDGDWHLSPYVGGGFGMMEANARVPLPVNNAWVGAYQVRGGVSLGFTEKLIGSLEYRWTIGSTPLFSLANIEVSRHSFVIGVHYRY